MMTKEDTQLISNYQVEMGYLLRMICIGFLQVSLPSHWYECVLNIVRLEQRLEYLAGTQRIYVKCCQHQDMLEGREREKRRML